MRPDHKNTPQSSGRLAWRSAQVALAGAREAIERGFDGFLEKHQRLFMYLRAQRKAQRPVELIGNLGDNESFS
jgi:uncharacterized protein (DUF924 family)